jgi:hypothetical protein
MPTIKERLEILESEVATLRESISAANGSEPRDWQRTIGAFTDDPGMQQILKDAMKLRDADRKRSKATNARRRKAGR